MAKSLRQSHLSLHQFAYTQTRVFLCPNWSLEPRKFQFVALQTELRITQIDFFIGLTKFYRAYDKFLSLCWKNFFTIVIIFCQRLEKVWQKYFYHKFSVLKIHLVRVVMERHDYILYFLLQKFLFTCHSALHYPIGSFSWPHENDHLDWFPAYSHVGCLSEPSVKKNRQRDISQWKAPSVLLKGSDFDRQEDARIMA